jgi:hypothetical protein
MTAPLEFISSKTMTNQTKRILNLDTNEITEVPLTAEEIEQQEIYLRDVLPTIELEKLRVKRNQLLAETDWTQSRDVTLPNDAEWATYRQALRDLPENTTDPANPVWPTKPS